MHAVDTYLDHLRIERRLSPRTVESYSHDLVMLDRFALGSERTVEMLGRQDLEAFVRGLMTAGLSPRTVARVVACVRGFYRFMAVDRRLATVGRVN